MKRRAIALRALGTVLLTWTGLSAGNGFAQPLPGGTVDAMSIPKYVTPLVIPPVMNTDGAADSYDIAVRQFEQQILPGGIWNTINGRPTPLPRRPCGATGRRRTLRPIHRLSGAAAE